MSSSGMGWNLSFDNLANKQVDSKLDPPGYDAAASVLVGGRTVIQ